MPNCSTCGTVVEFLRTTYAGKWRLFRNDTHKEVWGRYVKVPEGTPHCPVFHNLWSSTWTHNTYDPPADPVLGEISSPRQRKYFKGAIGGPLPLPIVIGADCVTLGATSVQPNPPGMLNGFLAGCFLQENAVNWEGFLAGKGQLTCTYGIWYPGAFQAKGQLLAQFGAGYRGRFQGKGQLTCLFGFRIKGHYQAKGQLKSRSGLSQALGLQAKGQLGSTIFPTTLSQLQAKGQLSSTYYTGYSGMLGGKGGIEYTVPP